MPITEDASIQMAMSPYGNTKQIGEEIIQDTAKVTNLKAVLLRYFNPIGGHDSAEIGELPLGVPETWFLSLPKRQWDCVKNYQCLETIIQRPIERLFATTFMWSIWPKLT